MSRLRSWVWIVLASALVAGGVRWCYVETHRHMELTKDGFKAKFEHLSGEADERLRRVEAPAFRCSVLQRKSGTRAVLGPAAAGTSDTTGPQKTLVYLFHLSDEPADPTSPAEIAATMAGVDQFYQANSYGAVSIKASVTDWLVIPVTHASICDPVNWVQMIRDAATAQGWAVSRYARENFIMPYNSSCSFTGSAAVGDTQAFFNGIPSVGVIAHEMGHGFGAWHSHGENCGLTGCTVDEYGDTYDVMGTGHDPSPYHMTAFQKGRLGWLGSSGPQKILNVTTSGIYNLTPYESGRGVKALLWREPGFGAGGGHGYYVEFRSGLGVLVHTGGQFLNSSGYQSPSDSLLKDLDAGSPLVSVLADGQTYAAPGATFASLSNGSIEVTIQ